MNAHPEFAQPVEPLAPEAAALLVDLGIEPPIAPDDGRQQPLDRRGVSLRWLFACALVGSCGAALLSAAILVAMRGDTSYPEQPETVTVRASSAAPARPTVSSPTSRSSRRATPCAHRCPSASARAR